MTQHTGHRRPAIVAFDVVGTLFSLEPLGFRLKEAGFSETALAEWFSRFLHAAVALDVANVFVPFCEVATATLEVMAAERGLASSGPAAERIILGMSELPAHPDAGPAFQGLREAGIRTIALTNGSAETTLHLLKQAGLEQYIERIVSIEEVRHWKPHAGGVSACRERCRRTARAHVPHRGPRLGHSRRQPRRSPYRVGGAQREEVSFRNGRSGRHGRDADRHRRDPRRAPGVSSEPRPSPTTGHLCSA